MKLTDIGVKLTRYPESGTCRADFGPISMVLPADANGLPTPSAFGQFLDAIYTDKLEERGGEWFVLSEEGEELSGPFESREQAAERLRQIEAAKAARGKNPEMDAANIPRTLMDADGTTVRRFDRCVAQLHCDEHRNDGIFMREDKDTGFLAGEARMARTGVQTYGDAEGNTWGEYRDAAEVFDEDSLRSYDLAVVTNDHPAEFVTMKNRASVDAGAIGTDARPDAGKFVRASLVVRDADTIRAIKAGKRDLSMGYTATVIVAPGVTNDGTPFKGRQTNIRINHVAIVDRGRAGPECGMELARGDAFTLDTKVNTMKTRKVKLADGTEVSVPVEVADKFEASRGDDANPDEPKTATVVVDGKEYTVPAEVADAIKADQVPQFAKGKGKGKEGEEGEEDEGKSKDSDSALRAKVDILEASQATADETFNARVDARSKLVTDARAVLGAEHKVDGVADVDLMRAIVVKAVPSMESKLDAHKGDVGYLRCAYDQAMELHGRREDAINDTNGAVFDAIQSGGEDPFLDALTHYNTRADRAVG